MSKNQKPKGKNSRLRLKFYEAGNTKCPICLCKFKKSDVTTGEATLEHAPPESINGSAICLTCRQCNNKASRLDHHAKIAKRAIDEWVLGLGASVEIDFLGCKKTLRYIPSDPNSPLPTRVSHLRRGSMKLGALPAPENLDVSKGIRFRIPRSLHYESVSMIKSAYLMVFSLMGEGGYTFAESDALSPVREQIMYPRKQILKGGFVVHWTMPDASDLEKAIVFLCHAVHPPLWVIPMWDEKAVLLPCGGPEPIDEFVSSENEIRIENHQLAGWTACRFNESSKIVGSVSQESDIEDGKLIGTTGLVPTNKGDWEWMVVEHYKGRYVALPYRSANARKIPDTLSVIDMLSSDAVVGRGMDKATLTAVNLGEWSKDMTICGLSDDRPSDSG